MNHRIAIISILICMKLPKKSGDGTGDFMLPVPSLFPRSVHLFFPLYLIHIHLAGGLSPIVV